VAEAIARVAFGALLEKHLHALRKTSVRGKDQWCTSGFVALVWIGRVLN